jgi:DNA helicase HerA-like ATPase
MYENGKIYMGLADGQRVELALNMCNRHGLIAGASGTGKTITMKVMAESFSDAGVPVFLCDIKGDVAGICAPGISNEGMEKRIDKFGVRDTFTYKAYPTTFWDIYQEGGHAVRATVSDMGPELLSRILGLTPAQEGILHIVFRIADDKGLLLIDLKDLRAMLTYVNEHRSEYMMTYGNITSQSVAAILRALLPLEQQGGDLFFGEPALDIRDWMRTDADGHGMINVLDCVKLVQNPTLYAGFLLWMLSELFENLPEAGDLDKPKLVFFFDEAHMLFRDAPAVLLQKIEQTVKLIRSRGVGVFFVTQSPSDIPNAVLAQLSNRVQHALRAYTPAELKAVRVAAQAFRANPVFQAEDAIMELGVGEALTSFLDEGGVPAMVQRTKIICPQSLMAAPEPMARAKVLMRDGMEKYDDYVDNLSAYEVLTEEAKKAETAKQEEADRKAREKAEDEAEKKRLKEEEADKKRQQKLEDEERKRQQKLDDEARRRQQKLEDEERRKAERQQEKAEAEAKRKAERRAAKIETQLISAGGQILKRGLLGVLKKR